MTASADKVQFILESSLEDTLPLVKKGVFSEDEFRTIMSKREQSENKMYSSTFKLSHFLKAIEFQYDLERQRQYQVKQQGSSHVNPFFKKQGSQDFAIVKRIIKLWDRTMHKYKYRPYLWKQYLQFCIAIKSKKHFYKALSQSLKFLPFESELWLVGIRYEVEIGLNMWKARKLFHKSLRMIPLGDRSVKITEELIKFQLEFVQKLHERQKVLLQGGVNSQESDIKFIMGGSGKNPEEDPESEDSDAQNQESNLQMLKLKEYHEVLFISITESIERNSKINKSGSVKNEGEEELLSQEDKSQIKQSTQITEAVKMADKLCSHFMEFLTVLISEEDGRQTQSSELICLILAETYSRLKEYRQGRKFAGHSYSELKIEEENLQVEAEEGNREDLQNGALEGAEVMIEEQEEYEKTEMKFKKIQKCTGIQKAQELVQKCRESSQFDKKQFSQALKQFCLKPTELHNLLELLIGVFFQESLKQLISSNQWLKLPLASLSLVIELWSQKWEQNSDKKQAPLDFVRYIRKQVDKVNPLEFRGNMKALKNVIFFNREIAQSVDSNNKLFRSIMVNGKGHQQFVEKSRSLFCEV